MVSFTLLRQYLCVLESRGINVSEILTSATIDEQIRNDPNSRMTARQHDLLWHELINHLSYTELTLKPGDMLAPSTFSSLIYLAMAQETLLDGLLCLLEKKNEGSEIQIHWSLENGYITFFPSDSYKNLQYSELYLSLAMQYVLDLLQWFSHSPILPHKVVLPNSPSFTFFSYLEQSDINIKTEVDRAYVSFLIEDVKIPLSGSHKGLKRSLEKESHIELMRFDQTQHWPSRIKCYLECCYRRFSKDFDRAKLISALSLSEAAAHHCVTPRTLQRKLEDSQTSFKQLLEEVRYQEVKYWQALGLNERELAEKLGYADPVSIKRFVT